MNTTTNTIDEIDATIDAIFNEFDARNALTIIDVSTTTFATRNDDDANDDDMTTRDMMISCM